ncbi:MKI67 FHA domain-interacting nucleolar phosphoprotein [Synchiropus splendidus]|uniref:MKI67 FHA domain-interacting nucleolar phosphoprotein n=1 Tax=Synchiropus splendidus TaxID=270530 RepID=UPI00237E00C8|nr:MKI67 FHA domain-interacting nucleolar phosphoprotein [Synchiropus splendidus]
MTETKCQELLALDPLQESEFKKKVKEAKKKKKRRPDSQVNQLTPGVIYVGHLPLGLFEPQLKSYFEQFGKVEKLRLSRSKKTGGSKGYAFVQYECDEVAEIVAETMNNYLMGERLIQCHVVPKEKVHDKMFVGSLRRFKKPSQPAVSRYNRVRSADQVTKMTDRLVHKEQKLRKRLAARGIQYDFPGFAAQVPPKKKRDLDSSMCSDDTTPVCTPSVLERRKATAAGDDGEDEVVIKMPPVEDLGSSTSEEEEEDDDDDDDGEEEA